MHTIICRILITEILLRLAYCPYGVRFALGSPFARHFSPHFHCLRLTGQKEVRVTISSSLVCSCIKLITLYHDKIILSNVISVFIQNPDKHPSSATQHAPRTASARPSYTSSASAASSSFARQGSRPSLPESFFRPLRRRSQELFP